MPTLTDSQIAGLLKSAGFPDNQIATGVAIALAESGGRTDAVNTANRNGTWDAGLMQVNSIHGYSQQYLFNANNNVQASKKIYDAAKGRWTPWSTYNNGSYRRFLARGSAAAGTPAAAPPATGETSNSPIQKGSIKRESGIFTGLFWSRVGLFLMGAFMVFMGRDRMTGIGEVVVKGAKLAATRGIRL